MYLIYTEPKFNLLIFVKNIITNLFHEYEIYEDIQMVQNVLMAVYGCNAVIRGLRI